MGTMIRKILVPNRGEIAVRIARCCREMGIASVLAFSESDDMSFTRRFFDQTVSLGSGTARETYLNIPKIIEAAKSVGADALHPGYGFLSERAELAQACADAGVTFIGPRAASIAAMGSKAEARHLMQKLGVPVVPGYDGEEQSHEALKGHASAIGFPLLVKASAGGGGKGMKIVHRAAELDEAIDSAKREALKAFGDDRLLLERYIEEPRHVELQIFGDSHGNIVHLYERDCSIQRRHQKVIEESPAPNFPDELRQRMALAAIAAARGVRYENAGTVEFILTPNGEFYFLEMNTRLQVEHPVTELVLGVDLVRAQIEVASGQPLPWTQEELRQRGHAIEMRVYAEDPDDRFLPQTGRIALYREPSGPGIRVDAGVEQGSEVQVNFDPMLAKLIAFGETRDAAIGRLDVAIRNYVLLGTKTNLAYVRRIVKTSAFAEGKVSTRFLVDHEAELRRVVPDEVAALAVALAGSGGGASRGSVTTATRIASVWETTKLP